MMNKKALFIWFKRYTGILEGGGLVNVRNFTLAQQVLGPDNVDSFYVHDEAHPRSLFKAAYSALLFPFGYFNGMTPAMLREIVRKAQNYDYVFINTSIFGIVAKRLKETGYKGTIIAHFHNVESIYYNSYISKNFPFRNIIINCAYRNDGYCMKYADRIITLNTRDCNLLCSMYDGRKADFILPISINDNLDKSRVSPSEKTSSRPKCAFIGSSFNANNEGILWFVRNVLPHVDIEFVIVGKGMAKFKAEKPELSNITVISDVPEIAPYYYDADFLIMPIFAGSGMKVKTCEALMYGKNILGSNESFEGYDIDAAKVGGRCNTAEEYISMLKHYSHTPITRYNSYSRSYYEKRHSPDILLESFRNIFS